MASVRIAALHKSYGSVHAVRGVDLDIPDGEFTADRVRSDVVPLLADGAALDAMRRAAASVGTRSGTENVLALIDRALGR